MSYTTHSSFQIWSLN